MFKSSTKKVMVSVLTATFIISSVSFASASTHNVNRRFVFNRNNKQIVRLFDIQNSTSENSLLQSFRNAFRINIQRVQPQENTSDYDVNVPEKDEINIPQDKEEAVPAPTPEDNTVTDKDSSVPSPVVTTPVPAEPKSDDPVAPEVTENTPHSNERHTLSNKEVRLVEYVNQARAEAGLAPLAIDVDLSYTARVKSLDMHDNNYFSHTSPTYGSPFDMMRSFGIQYRAAAENIARTHSVESAHNGLMNSDGHRKNILNPNFTHIGIGIYNGYYTQMFIQK
ncbi:CAP domain-containing protein [Serpentinicella sp. ANB-PHB4]|uniref:CAP domain-containing protein n=1 Tax=Serpentinicella sp. ANB-PHB4 TaxID=3074076 RepID=UPI00285A6830|nr:CAP domain-containing protein [Serpentinicella sp. ANB-PHB4]MDR5658093.1 CAP domain-containing protein [Serpentinicella sp. ANB-PHB4]